MSDDNLCFEHQVMNEYEVTYVNGEVVEVEAWTPTIAQAIAEEDADLSGRPLSVVSVKLLRQLPTRGVAPWTSSIPERVAANLSELGLPAPTNVIQTMLMHDGYFVGWKFRYDGGYAILHSDGNAMELYDEQGTLLKTVARGIEREAA